MEWIDVKLHPELADATHRIAQERDISVGQLVRDLLSREISSAHRARPPVKADERLIAHLRARLAGDLGQSKSWEELNGRLREKGYCLIAAGAGLALHDCETGRRVCKASELGFSYSKLATRIGAPFPGHPHTYLNNTFANAPLLDAQAPISHMPVTPRAVRDITDDFDVIEPF